MSSHPESTDERVGLVLRDKWRLERLLGVGGMASVYLARHEIGRYDAIKILHDQFADNEGIRKRFEREARAVNHFRHPGAVEIRDIDATRDGSPFLVMEYLEGEPLQDLLKRGKLPVDRVLDIMIDVLDVLGAAHDQRIIHRDIKPANLFVLDDGRVKVLDFGIARMKEAAGSGFVTEEGALLGTGGYMPPEQIMGNEIDHRADLFAVGATMFRILAGRPVQRANNASSLLVKMATEPAPRLLSVAPDLAPALGQVVDLALGFDRDARYPDAATMQQDLRAVRQAQPPPYAAAVTAGDLEAASVAQTAAHAQRESSSRNGGSGNQSRPRMSTAQRMEGRVVNDRYRLDRLIGKGGMGAVYAATDVRTDTQVAMKLVLSHLTGEESSTPGRFRREARAAMAIHSPHAVEVLDADVDERGVPFLVMELLEGRDLERWLEQVRPIGQDAAVKLFLQAAQGVAAAHAQDIVHRDIKPANLFLSKTAMGEVVVKVLDFGLAKQRSAEGNASQSLTETGGVLGTPRYASPEQVKNAKLVDKKSDVWSLCMTMYEALSGKVPWSQCEAVGEIIIAIATTDVTPLAEVAPWVDAKLAAVVDRGLARDPTQRWQDAAELVAQLQPWVSDPVLRETMLAGRASQLSLNVHVDAGVPSTRSVPGVGGSFEQPPRRRAPVVLGGLAVLGIAGLVAATALRTTAPETQAGPATTSEPAPVEEPKVAPTQAASVASALPSTSSSVAAGAPSVDTPKVVSKPAGPRPSPVAQPAAPKPIAPPTVPKPKSSPAPGKPPPKLELKREW